LGQLLTKWSEDVKTGENLGGAASPIIRCDLLQLDVLRLDETPQSHAALATEDQADALLDE
jgi:hypothetical protein